MTTLQLPICNDAHFKAHFETELFAAETISTLQINIGYVCNLACHHCHVESSPARTDDKDNMNRETARKVIDWVLSQPSIKKIDFTGGSPEMNPNFRRMVRAFREHDLHIINRCNPTIIEYKKMVDAGFGSIEVRSRRPYRMLDKKRYDLDSDLLLETVEVCAYRTAVPGDGPCVFTGRTAFYTGSDEMFDDGKGHTLIRDIPLNVCDKTAVALASLKRGDISITDSTWHYAGGGCC